MPLTIDTEKFAAQETLDMSKPQGSAQGIPVKMIAHQEYPRCVYKHPVEPYREVVHRNVNHEIVDRELVATEHRVHICANAAEMKKKLQEGYQLEPYIQQAPPDATDALYDKVTGEVEKRLSRRKAAQADGANEEVAPTGLLQESDGQ